MDRQVTRADLERLLSDQDADPVALPLSLLGEITDGFSSGRIIGRGGFAVVYKGILKNGAVAVKMISDAHMHEKEFIREVECLMKAKHKNVVRFLGYCGDRQQKAEEFDGKFVMADVEQRLLCFDFLPKGSLRCYIKDASCGLEWRQRFEIIREICEGLQYLHQKNIIHCDLKPENILLNHNMVPQIADFGLSRCFAENQSRLIVTTMGGTLGYMPPEYLNKEVTHQFDLYSLGVIMMEVVTGKRDYDDLEKVLEGWRNRPEMPQRDTMLRQIRACMDIWTRCIDNNRANRPTIQHIIDKLNEMGSMYSSTDTGMRSLRSSPVEKIIRMEKGYAKIVSVDVHSARPWIIITHFEGPFRVLNYQTEEFVMPADLTREQKGMTFLTAKFIERKEWIVAGGCDGYIYVFDSNTMEKLDSFDALTEQITSLAIHRTKDYVLASSYDFEIGLWDWANGWESVQKFEDAHDGSVPQVAFDPKDDNAFASVSKDGTIKIWRIGSSRSKTLTWHSSNASTSYASEDSADSTTVRCLDYFSHENNQYLITGSDDGTVKIWDVQKTDPVETLSGHKKRVSAVCSHPELPVLMTGSRDGTVCVWNSNSFGLERTLAYDLGEVHALGCIKGSNRVVIGHTEGLAIVEVDKDM